MKRCLLPIVLALVGCHHPRSIDWVDPGPSDDVALFAPDGVVASVGLQPLRSGSSVASREVRIWVGGGLAMPEDVYRFVERGGGVEGDRILFWPSSGLGSDQTPGETTHDLMQYTLRGRCGEFVLRRDYGTCHAMFVRRPDWAKLLERLEANELWSLPDQSTLPNTRAGVDGWGITVELRDGRRYRAYHYSNPDRQEGPEAKRAAAIAKELRVVDELTREPASYRRYRGTTTGRRNSDFHPCASSETWWFTSDLGQHAKAGRVEMPDPPSDTTSEYYVELTGEIAPEWLARRWDSPYPHALQVIRIHRVARAVPSDCQRHGTGNARNER